MTAPARGKRPPLTLLHLLVAVGALVVLLVAYLIGTTASESRRATVIPGVGPVAPLSADAAAKMPVMAGGGGARGAGRGMGGPITMGRAGFEVQPVAESPAPPSPPASWPKAPMLIRMADLRLRVDDVPGAHAAIGRIARDAGGYIADTTLSAEGGPASATITIRVPSQGLDSAIDRVAALGQLLNKHISAQEVTEEYVDLTSRRRNLEREELRLLDLLQRAGKVRDLLEVESTLARVRGEIETIAGRLRYLENRISLSTLTVQLEGPEPPPTTGAPAWAARDVYRQALRSLVATGRGLATMGIWLAVYAVVWVPILAIVVWFVRKAIPRPTRETSERAPGS